MRIAFIQPIGGASGDMMLGALTDLGMPIEHLEDELGKLKVGGYRLEARVETRCEMRGTYLKVDLEDRTRYSPRQLLDTVESSSLPQRVKDRSCLVLKALWNAECRVHGETQDILELEELGSVDTLVDVVGSSIGFEYLGVEGFHSAPLVIGNSTPPRRAGGYSNPAPATLQLIAATGASVASDNPMYDQAGELTTPTGAALITTLAAFNRPAFSVDRVGLGLGTKDPAAFSNSLRVWLGETEAEIPEIRTSQSTVVLLETNLDDVSGLVLGYTQERLFAIGALDVWNTPIQMKKNRPATMLSVLVGRELVDAAAELIFKETSTLGIRRRPVRRYEAERQVVTVDTSLGKVPVKLKRIGDTIAQAAPEYEACRAIARETGLPLVEVMRIVSNEATMRGSPWSS